jgi:hypothetical protein
MIETVGRKTKPIPVPGTLPSAASVIASSFAAFSDA